MEGFDAQADRDARTAGGRGRAAAGRSGFARLLRVAVPLVIVAAAAAAAMMVATRPEVPRKPVEERVWLVSATPVEVRDVRPELRLFGEVVAAREAELRPLVAGPVVAIGPNFDPGGRVQKGELLVAIDNFAFESALAEAEAQLAEARARLDELRADRAAEEKAVEQDRSLVALRERDVARRVDLRERGSGTQKSLDDARLALAQQRQQLIAREQALAGLEARIAQQEAVIQRLEVARDRARRDLEDSRLRAPFDAFVVEADAAVGRRVSVNARVATLVEAKSLEARFHMSDDTYGRLAARDGFIGANAVVTWRSAAQDFSFPARIDRVSGAFDPASGGVEVFARIEGLGLDTVLRPGAFVEVRMPDRRFEDVVRLPEVAVHRPLERGTGEDGARNPAKVYVAVDGRLEERAVEIVGRDGADLLVDGALEPGELVVTTNFAQIGPGVKVEVR